MKSRLRTIFLTLLFLLGNVQASIQASSCSIFNELKIASASVLKWISDENNLGEDDFAGINPWPELHVFNTCIVS